MRTQQSSGWLNGKATRIQLVAAVALTLGITSNAAAQDTATNTARITALEQSVSDLNLHSNAQEQKESAVLSSVLSKLSDISSESVAANANVTKLTTALQAAETTIGKNSTKLGALSTATGNNSTAIGTLATSVGDNSSALGTLATAVGDNATAIGNGALASANNAIAIGEDAHAAGTNSKAIGNGAQAHANDALAIGHNANASATGATAIGHNAVATRENQFTLGTSSNTYSLPGIASSASRAAQGPVVGVVTTDANGNLASDGGAMFRKDEELADGIAIAMAMSAPILQQGQIFAMRGGWGHFKGSNAMSFTVAGLVNRGFLGTDSTVVIDAGVGFATGGQDSVGGRAGISIAW